MAVKFHHFYCSSHKVPCGLYVYNFTVDGIRDQPKYLPHKTYKVVSKEIAGRKA